MGPRLINANEFEDLFLYGIDDMAVTGDQKIDGLMIDLIREQQTVKAVPYYQIAQAILKIRGLNSGFDYIPRQDVVDILWRLIDERPKEAADDKL